MKERFFEGATSRQKGFVIEEKCIHKLLLQGISCNPFMLLSVQCELDCFIFMVPKGIKDDFRWYLRLCAQNFEYAKEAKRKGRIKSRRKDSLLWLFACKCARGDTGKDMNSFVKKYHEWDISNFFLR